MNLPSIQKLLLLSVLPLLVVTAACDDDEGPLTPALPALTASTTSLDFGDLDVNFGAGLPQDVALTNGGSSAFRVESVTLTGAGAGDFTLVDGDGAFSLAPGATRSVRVAFDPSTEGPRASTLSLTTDDPNAARIDVALTGTGARYRYRQVDRLGIPALNTVFNHPPDFSKKAYNTASPASDLETYRGQFEVVLGAVANPDPAATAALLLPDELPVSLGAGTTTFAQLTGRALADDAVDIALTVVVGIPSLHSDHVDANDTGFSPTFPYLAPPNL